MLTVKNRKDSGNKAEDDSSIETQTKPKKRVAWANQGNPSQFFIIRNRDRIPQYESRLHIKKGKKDLIEAAELFLYDLVIYLSKQHIDLSVEYNSQNETIQMFFDLCLDEEFQYIRDDLSNSFKAYKLRCLESEVCQTPIRYMAYEADDYDNGSFDSDGYGSNGYDSSSYNNDSFETHEYTTTHPFIRTTLLAFLDNQGLSGRDSASDSIINATISSHELCHFISQDPESLAKTQFNVCSRLANQIHEILKGFQQDLDIPPQEFKGTKPELPRHIQWINELVQLTDMDIFTQDSIPKIFDLLINLFIYGCQELDKNIDKLNQDKDFYQAISSCCQFIKESKESNSFSMTPFFNMVSTTWQRTSNILYKIDQIKSKKTLLTNIYYDLEIINRNHKEASPFQIYLDWLMVNTHPQVILYNEAMTLKDLNSIVERSLRIMGEFAEANATMLSRGQSYENFHTRAGFFQTFLAQIYDEDLSFLFDENSTASNCINQMDRFMEVYNYLLNEPTNKRISLRMI